MKFNIYIDNQLITLRKKNFKSIGEAIVECNKLLAKSEKIPAEIFVNGEAFSEKSFSNYKDGTIEIITKCHNKIVLESIHSIEERGLRFFQISEELEYVDPNTPDIAKRISEQVNIVGWFFNVMLSLRRNGIEVIGDISVDELIDELREEQNNLREAFMMGDEDIVLEILEFEISSIIGEFMDVVEENLEELLDEYRSTSIRLN